MALGLNLLFACQAMQPDIKSPTDTTPGHNPQIELPTPQASLAISPSEAGDQPEQTQYENIWERLRDGFQLSQYYQRTETSESLVNYAGNQRFFDLVAARATPFLYEIVEEIDKRGLPMELALIPIVESTFNPNAYSREHAVGLWQFVPATGKSFGLQQDWWYDARRDPAASTIAALDYLQELHQQFHEDWLLAMAAYNTGDGNLRRAIRRSKQSPETAEFWSLRLSSETRAHVPRILALARLIADSKAYDIELPAIANEPQLARIDIKAQIDLSKAAELAGVDYETLRALNPGYRQWATHPDHPHSVAVPKQQLPVLLAALETIDRDQLVTWDRYQIRSGDTLGGIARRLHTRVDVLQTVNRLHGSRIIAGDSLLIPRSNAAASLGDLLQISPEQVARVTLPPRYTVRRGDNLWSIARRYQLKSAEVALWNKIALDSLLMPGQVLDLQFASDAANVVNAGSVGNDQNPLQRQRYYRVQRGDSMAKIADKIDAKLQLLLSWNGISDDELIFPGQQIRIAAPEPGQD
jgi:membrane-bound lytic murein transglycosylase D